MFGIQVLFLPGLEIIHQIFIVNRILMINIIKGRIVLSTFETHPLGISRPNPDLGLSITLLLLSLGT